MTKLVGRIRVDSKGSDKQRYLKILSTGTAFGVLCENIQEARVFEVDISDQTLKVQVCSVVRSPASHFTALSYETLGRRGWYCHQTVLHAQPWAVRVSSIYDGMASVTAFQQKLRFRSYGCITRSSVDLGAQWINTWAVSNRNEVTNLLHKDGSKWE